jgi:hypothetical protein
LPSPGTVQTDNEQHVEGECGYRVEGCSRPNKNQIIFSRLKRRGVDVQYVAMDEPVTFGYFYHRKNACKDNRTTPGSGAHDGVV